MNMAQAIKGHLLPFLFFEEYFTVNMQIIYRQDEFPLQTMWQTINYYLILHSAFCANFLQTVLNIAHDLFLISGKFSNPLMEESCDMIDSVKPLFS